jgi:hypothetical protein
MTTAKNRVRRIAAVGALAVAAAAVPALAALGASGTQTSSATGTCLAWYGSRDDGICLSYSNGQGVNVGTPQVGIGGPNSSSPGVGITTGPLLPGQTISIPLG